MNTEQFNTWINNVSSKMHRINIPSESKIKRLNKLLLEDNGSLRIRPAALYQQLQQEELSYFCHVNSFYSLPTTELIDWLKQEIGNMTAVEIGAGKGNIGKALGIIQTDSMIQSRFDYNLTYKIFNQPPICTYPDNVEKLDALRAIRKYKPEVVVASWVTQRNKSIEEVITGHGSNQGINEERLLKNVKKYILIGNEEIHNEHSKKICKLPHKKYKFPWLYSRSLNKKDIIYVWEP